jgi:hypothetical protein
MAHPTPSEVVAAYQERAEKQRGSFEGEVCTLCGKQAAHKLEELLHPENVLEAMHPMSATVCAEHFLRIFCPYLFKDESAAPPVSVSGVGDRDQPEHKPGRIERFVLELLYVVRGRRTWKRDESDTPSEQHYGRRRR